MIDRDSIIAWLTDIGQGNTCPNDSEMARETLAHLRLCDSPALTPSQTGCGIPCLTAAKWKNVGRTYP